MATRKLKHRYLQTLGIIIMLLALVRCIFIGEHENSRPDITVADSTEAHGAAPSCTEEGTTPDKHSSKVPMRAIAGGKGRTSAKSRFIDYTVVFNDSNHVQLLAAQQWGVSPVKDREDAERRKDELVYMACSPYYDVAHLDASIPYLVPHAAILLQDIGMAFTDSLQARKMPLYRIVVSSVLRTEADVTRLRRSNKNATEQSCHLYATTFDINYTAFSPVGTAREIDGDTEIRLKSILGQVLYDLQLQGRCFVKYERRQPCFHITVR